MDEGVRAMRGRRERSSIAESPRFGSSLRARMPALAAAALVGCAQPAGPGTESTLSATAGSTGTDTSTQGSTTPTQGSTHVTVTQSDTEQPHAAAPEGRWVLRDKDGNAVKALVEPRCGVRRDVAAYAGCLPLDFDTARSFPCVRVIDHEARYVNVEFELQTGQIAPCNQHIDNTMAVEAQSWDEVAGAIYVNDQCTGDVHVTAELGEGYFNPEFTGTRGLWFAVGGVWYAREEGCVKASSWVRNQDNTCSGPHDFGRTCPLAPVPEWVLTLLPDPPYSMQIEYGDKP